MSKLSATTPQTVPKRRIIQLVSAPWHKESPKDGALMLTSSLFALCDDGVVLNRQFDPVTRRWVWKREDVEFEDE